VTSDPGSRTPRDRRPAARPDGQTSGLAGTPRGRQAPAGLDRARRRADAPPRPTRGATPVPKPDLPTDEQPHIPRGVRREIERVLGKGTRADEVALALSVGGDAIDLDRSDVALEVLAWAKDAAPRVAAVREAYGVARYLAEDWAGALTELQAYRRMSGRVDQNHLVADCLRALGREPDRIIEPLEERLADDDVAEDRRAEAVIVWAATLADGGDVAGGRAVLRRHLGRAGAEDAAHDLRVRVLAAELAERAGDDEEARRLRAEISAAGPELLEEAEVD
jgi:hypothetical protein